MTVSWHFAVHRISPEVGLEDRSITSGNCYARAFSQRSRTLSYARWRPLTSTRTSTLAPESRGSLSARRLHRSPLARPGVGSSVHGHGRQAGRHTPMCTGREPTRASDLRGERAPRSRSAASRTRRTHREPAAPGPRARSAPSCSSSARSVCRARARIHAGEGRGPRRDAVELLTARTHQPASGARAPRPHPGQLGASSPCALNVSQRSPAALRHASKRNRSESPSQPPDQLAGAGTARARQPSASRPHRGPAARRHDPATAWWGGRHLATGGQGVDFEARSSRNVTGFDTAVVAAVGRQRLAPGRGRAQYPPRDDLPRPPSGVGFATNTWQAVRVEDLLRDLGPLRGGRSRHEQHRADHPEGTAHETQHTVKVTLNLLVVTRGFGVQRVSNGIASLMLVQPSGRQPCHAGRRRLGHHAAPRRSSTSLRGLAARRHR